MVRNSTTTAAGVRGDMQAVIKAILLDYEARSTNTLTRPTFGKQREPLLRVTAAGPRVPRAGPAEAAAISQNGNQTITVTTAQTASAELRATTCFCVFTGHRPDAASRIYNNVAVTSPNELHRHRAGRWRSEPTGRAGTTITVTNNSHGLVGRCQCCT